MKNLLWIVAIIAIVFSIVHIFGDGKQAVQDIAEIVEPQKPLQPYSLVESKCKKPHKCVYDVIIEDAISKEDVKAIAEKIKKDSPSVKLVAVNFNLSCMKKEDNWAYSWWISAKSKNNSAFDLWKPSEDINSCADYKALLKNYHLEIEKEIKNNNNVMDLPEVIAKQSCGDAVAKKYGLKLTGEAKTISKTDKYTIQISFFKNDRWNTAKCEVPVKVKEEIFYAYDNIPAKAF